MSSRTTGFTADALRVHSAVCIRARGRGRRPAAGSLKDGDRRGCADSPDVSARTAALETREIGRLHDHVNTREFRFIAQEAVDLRISLPPACELIAK